MKPPNVILVMTDDQGYGDLGCTGNPWIRTPHIDAFHQQAVRLTDFHVSPLCTPTRGALMSGRRPIRNGAWATTWGRSMLRRDERTMADVFADGGYRTGMFGKWHLGDNYPYRPQDRGFQHVVAHRGGGVGQTPDFWGNNYFDDTYFHNGRPVAHAGYCTDVWFAAATAFIKDHRERPFFAYIATNAPHSPYLVAARYRALYEGNPDIPEPAFYGMITNIDENFGALLATLEELGIAADTIIIFMTDNGSSGGARLGADGLAVRGWNAGMRGMKGAYYDGGHRVPCFIRWPRGGIGGGRDLTGMALHLDLLPTLIDLCALPTPDHAHGDGISLTAYLSGTVAALPERTQFLQYRQGTAPPEKWDNAVMTSRWRLIGGRKLYDISTDPAQQHNVAAQYPEVVARLRAQHEQWWAEVSPGLAEYCPITIGSDSENPTRLDAFDVMGDVAWNQTQIVRARESSGCWAVDVAQPGDYTISLRRWPTELGLPIDAVVPPAAAGAHTSAPPDARCVRVEAVAARLGIFDQEWRTPVQPAQDAATFHVTLRRAGVTCLHAWFVDAADKDTGAYYVYIEKTRNSA